MLVLENVGLKEETPKARFVVQGHKDAEKNMIATARLISNSRAFS